MGTKEKIHEDVEVLDQEVHKYEIVLHNDDVNTFDFVIESLISVCEHTLEQAEQCALLAHNRGQIDIASGPFKEMYEILETLDHVKVGVSLEAYESNLH